MKKIKTLIIVLGLLLVLGGCTTTGEQPGDDLLRAVEERSDPEQAGPPYIGPDPGWLYRAVIIKAFDWFVF